MPSSSCAVPPSATHAFGSPGGAARGGAHRSPGAHSPWYVLALPHQPHGSPSSLPSNQAPVVSSLAGVVVASSPARASGGVGWARALVG